MTAAADWGCYDRNNGKRCRHQAYKMRCDDFTNLWQRADGRCEICRRAGKETGHGYLVIDHDVSVGPTAVRGLLCNRCNSRLHEKEMAGPTLDRYLASAWHFTTRVLERPEYVMVRPRPEMEEAARAGLRMAGVPTEISKPMLRAIINGLGIAGFLREASELRTR